MREPQTEQEWADYYQAHKDDPEEWGDPVPPPPAVLKRARGRPSQRRSAVITVRFTPEEMAIVRQDARAHESTYSDVIRRAVQLLAEKQRPPSES
jgi:hypothetical protein